MAGISIQEIDHLANLSRIELTQAEKKKYAEQISDILDYVKKLGKLDTKNIEPTRQVTGLENVWGEDKIAASGKRQATRKEILKNAPLIKDRHIKVKTILNV